MNTQDFEYFKNNGGGNTLKMAGVNIEKIESFKGLSKALQANKDEFLPILKAAHKNLSSGEKPILEAVLCACGFAETADKLSDGRSFRSIKNMSESYKKCYLLALGSN